MKRDSFVFYRSFFEAIEKLKKNDKLTVYSHLCRYALGEEVDELDGVPGAIFDLIKPQIDANFQRYENGTKGGKYGKLGGRPKTPKEPQENPKQTPNVNVNENVNDNENVNVNVNAPVPDGEQTTHTPTFETEQTNRPSNLDVLGEIVQHGYRLEGKSIKAFMDYNDERGWKMDWRLALKRWADREQTEQPKQNKAGKFANFPQRDDPEHKALVAKLINSQLANGGG